MRLVSAIASHLVLVAGLTGVATLANAEDAKTETKVAAKAPVDSLTFTNKLVDGKKTWTPGEGKVKAGDAVELTLVNTLPEPHGFAIKGLTEDLVVNANETKTVSIPADKVKAGAYDIKCQLHPAHVGAKLVVQ
jgi:nitrosocyanin